MKIVFFFVLLLNIVYFLWQYLQESAPLTTDEIALEQTGEKQILLLTERVQSSNNAVGVSNTAIGQTNRISFATLDKIKGNKCYQVGIFENNTVIDKWAEKLKIDSALLQRQQKNKPVIKDYLVYYPAETSFKESLKNFEMLKNLGVKEAWLFRKGQFKGDISLGMFKSKTRAMQLQKEFFDKSIFAAVKPRYKIPPQFYVNLQTDKTPQQLKKALKYLVKKSSVELLNECY